MSKHMNPRRLRGTVAIRADGDDLAGLFAELNTSFAEFKASMTAKEKETSKRFDDVVTTEKLERINASISETNAKYQSEIDKLNAQIAGLTLNGGVVSRGAITCDARFLSRRLISCRCRLRKRRPTCVSTTMMTMGLSCR